MQGINNKAQKPQDFSTIQVASGTQRNQRQMCNVPCTEPILLSSGSLSLLHPHGSTSDVHCNIPGIEAYFPLIYTPGCFYPLKIFCCGEHLRPNFMFLWSFLCLKIETAFLKEMIFDADLEIFLRVFFHHLQERVITEEGAKRELLVC